MNNTATITTRPVNPDAIRDLLARKAIESRSFIRSAQLSRLIADTTQLVKANWHNLSIRRMLLGDLRDYKAQLQALEVLL